MLEISDLGSLEIKNCNRSQKNLIIPNNVSNISDRLDALIETGEIFDNPDKVRLLKKEKLI